MTNSIVRLTAVALLAIGAAGCNDTTAPAGTPIDCATLATSLATTTDLTTTSTGLKYRDVTVGTGATAAAGQTVAVHYSGCLTSGVQFDQNLDNQTPFIFKLGANQVIAGFDQGITGMKIGGRRQLVIPPSLGYGANANGPIPGNSTLVFTVDLVAAQ